MASGGLNSSMALESSLVEDFFDELVDEVSGVEISAARRCSMVNKLVGDLINRKIPVERHQLRST